jgi:hypothetical protein
LTPSIVTELMIERSLAEGHAGAVEDR